MPYVLAGAAVLLLLAVVVGVLTGRVSVRACCSAGGPARDRRLREATGREPSAGT